MKKLRSGYTTGACAAAAAKGATLCLLGHASAEGVDIPFPDGRRVYFTLIECRRQTQGAEPAGYAAVVKDAGDDPDVTNGALIAATVRFAQRPETHKPQEIVIVGGEGVGTVTKPGLAVAIGEPAINPVPLRMIREAVTEALSLYVTGARQALTVEISVPRGKELAEKTLNERLGIVGGISILGTTGVVRPVSAEAWTATITSAMNVAAAGGSREIVLSTGRTSEAALQRTGKFKPEALIMMGDYLEFALQEAAKYPFERLHMAGMWAKILKAALRIPQTHVRFGALEVERANSYISKLFPKKDLLYLAGANTAREIHERLLERGDLVVVQSICRAAKEYHQEMSGIPVTVYLVHHTGRITAQVEE